MCLLLGRTCTCASHHPLYLLTEYRLTFSLRRLKRSLSLCLKLKKAAVICIVGIELTLIKLNYACTYGIKEISVMCNHDQGSVKALKPLLKPCRHLTVKMVGRLVEHKYIAGRQQHSRKSKSLALSSRELSCRLIEIKNAELGKHGLGISLTHTFTCLCQYTLKYGMLRIKHRSLRQISYYDMSCPAYPALVLLFFACNNTKKCGFTRSVDAYNTHTLAFI